MKIQSSVHTESLVREVEALYGEVDQCLGRENIHCRMCGNCCDFKANGLRLYALESERILIRRRCGAELHLQSGICSARKNARCTVHPFRPLGCRTQFCDATLDHVYEKYKKQLQAVEEDHGIPYSYRDIFLQEDVHRPPGLCPTRTEGARTTPTIH